MSKVLLITGATGKQGGSVIRALLSHPVDFQILALTRDASSASAKKLAAQSSQIRLIEGNLDDADAIFESAKQATSLPVWGVFSVQTPAMNKTGLIIEEKQGKTLVDVALKNGVAHFVYSSVDRNGARSANNPTNIPHFISKHYIEQYLFEKTKGGKMGWTVLRPVAFMENFDGGFVGKVFASSWKIGVKSRSLQLIATNDIGVFAAKAFTAPTDYQGRSLSLAGDELTYDQMMEVFKQKTGSAAPLTWDILAKFVLWLSKEMGTMFKFFEQEGYGANVQELRKIHPELQSLGAWLEGSSYAKKQK